MKNYLVVLLLAFVFSVANSLPLIAQSASEAESPQSCLPTQPSAAIFTFSSPEINAGETLDIDVEAPEDLSDFTVTLSEQDKSVDDVLRFVRRESVGEIRAGNRRKMGIVLPNNLQRSVSERLIQRGKTRVTPHSKIFLLEAEGKTADGKDAYSSQLVTFQEQPGGAFKVLPLYEHLQTVGNTVGGLDILRPKDLTIDKGEISNAKPVELMDRVMDETGRISLRDPIENEASKSGTVTVTVSGYIYMQGSDGVNRPASSVEVAVWEDDGSSAYASSNNILLTSSSGYFSTVVSHNDGDNSLELFLRVRTINSWVRMGNYISNGSSNCTSGNSYCGLSLSSNEYQWDGPVVTGVTSGSKSMNYTISDSRKGAAQIFVWLNDAGGFTRGAFDPGQARAVYGLPGNGAFSLPSYNYNLVFSDIHGNIGGEDVSYHEHGHLTMFRRNSYANPNIGGPHNICTLIHPAFAWVEGWASGFAQYVDSDGYYNANNLNRALAVENTGVECYMNNTSSAHDEFWVAAAVNDFYDFGEPSGGDDPANRVNSFSEVMEFIRTTNIDSIEEFHDKMVSSGTLTTLEKHYSSRAARHNEFDCCIPLIPSSAPPAPTNLVVTGNTGQSPSLNWSSSSGADGYKIYRCENVSYSCSSYSYIGSTSNTNYTDNSKTVGNSCNGISGPDEITWYYVKAYNAAGDSGQSNSPSTCTDANKADIANDLVSSPESFKLHGNYPNPFNPVTEIRFDLPEAAHVRLVVYDMSGREVARILDRTMSAGFQRIPFEAKLPSGRYIYQLEAGKYSESKIMTLLK